MSMMRALIFVAAGLCFLWSAAEGTCNVNDVPVDPKFKEKKLLGQWIRWRTWRASPIDTTYDYVLDLHYGESDTLLYTDNRRTNVTSACQVLGPFIVEDRTNTPGDYLVPFADAVARIMEIKKNYVVMFFCDGVGSDGVCQSPNFEIYYRAGTKRNECKWLDAAARHLEDACVDPNYVASNIVTNACVPGDSGGNGCGSSSTSDEDD